MKPKYKLELSHIDGWAMPKFSIWERRPGAFWGEQWIMVTYQPLPLDLARKALEVLQEFEKEAAP